MIITTLEIIMETILGEIVMGTEDMEVKEVDINKEEVIQQVLEDLFLTNNNNLDNKSVQYMYKMYSKVY
jgi:hypothetical protein